VSVIIGKLEFEGPFSDPSLIRPEPGIFGIVCEADDELELIDLDETECLQDCLSTNEHVNNLLFYSETCNGKLSAIVHYVPDLTPSERIEIKQELLKHLNAETEEAPALV
jgi:hypothetical protein